MNILFDINHPAHVHLFRNAIQILKTKGHNVLVTSREKDITIELLNKYKISHNVLSKAQNGLLKLGLELVTRQCKLLPILMKNKINICISATGACSVHICKLLRIPTLVFYDTEHAKLQNKLTIPFATKFITPASFKDSYGQNHIVYNGFHDLAYCHPNYFKPDPSVLNDMGVEEKSYVILRLVSWQAAHDVGHKGISTELKRSIIKFCEQHGRVFILSESALEKEFDKYRLCISPEKMLDVLYYARIYIGEGGSMATESALLGTPAIFVSTLKAGVFDHLEKDYNIMYTFTPDQKDEIQKTLSSLLNDKNTIDIWRQKKDRIVSSKTDLTKFMIDKILEFSS